MKPKGEQPFSLLGTRPGPFHMEINGNREVFFEGNRGIVGYGEDTIKLSAGKMLVVFHGRGLHIKCMNQQDVVIHGFLTSIEYIL